MMNTIKIYVTLLEEGTDTWRPTQALDKGSGLYELLPTPKYDPEDEIWEFKPGSLVKAIEVKTDEGEKLLLAVKA